jgi:hypothetical protein
LGIWHPRDEKLEDVDEFLSHGDHEALGANGAFATTLVIFIRRSAKGGYIRYPD